MIRNKAECSVVCESRASWESEPAETCVLGCDGVTRARRLEMNVIFISTLNPVLRGQGHTESEVIGQMSGSDSLGYVCMCVCPICQQGKE